MFGAVFSALCAFPFFWLMGFHDLWLVTAAVTAGLAIAGDRPCGNVWPAGEPILRVVQSARQVQRGNSGLPAGFHLRRRTYARGRDVAACGLQGRDLAGSGLHGYPGADNRCLSSFPLFLSETYKKSEGALDAEAEAPKPGE
jgi:hypothetical protein